MVTELVAEGDITDYGSTQKEEALLVGIPGAMMDRSHQHPTSSNKPSSRPLWKTKKFVVLGIIGMMLAAGVVVATLLGDSSAGPAQTGQSIWGRGWSYPRVTIVNDTPYDVRPYNKRYTVRYSLVGYVQNPEKPYKYSLKSGWGLEDDTLEYTDVGHTRNSRCYSDLFDDPGIKAGQRWIPSRSRGTCLVNKVVAVLSLPDGRGVLQCTNYEYEHDVSETGSETGNDKVTGGTAKSIFYVRMGGGDGCCVLGSWQRPRCAPKQTFVRNPDYNYDSGENE